MILTDPKSEFPLLFTNMSAFIHQRNTSMHDIDVPIPSVILLGYCRVLLLYM